MITTVTTSTVTSVTTTIGFAVAISLIAVISLLCFLCAKEIVVTHHGNNRGLLARSFDVGIVPLLISFAIIVTMKVVTILA